MKQAFDLIEQGIKGIDYPKQPGNLYAPIEYIMGLGGKRLRPYLLMLSAQGFGKPMQDVVSQAVAIEVFHNFTLVHDDIMDHAPLRRGNTTVHEKWDQNIAILSGDTMMVKSYQLLMDGVESQLLPAVFETFNDTAVKVCEGQQMDMDFETTAKVSVEEYLKMIRLKTAELLGGAMKIGAILAEAPKEEQEAIYSFAINTGVAFQLMDDLLDVYADQAKFGKQVGGDIIENKKTYLFLQLEKKVNQEDLKIWEELKTSENAEQKVNGVKELYSKYQIKSDTEKLIEDYYRKGLNDLETVSISNEAKQAIAAFADKLAVREV